MYAIILVLLSFTAFFLAYRFYARYLSRKIFQLDPQRQTPAHELRDGLDYVPTKKIVLFGHHFVSIAGLAPMLGPAIAVIWGWLPALLWVVFGTIFLGAVHDFAALYISIRNNGRSIGDASDDIINPRARILFMLIIAFLIALAMGVFTFIIALLFVKLHPSAVIPVLSLMVIAMLVGALAYKTRLGITGATLVGIGLMFGFIYVGMKNPIASYKWFLTEDTRQFCTAEGLDLPATPGAAAVILNTLKNDTPDKAGAVDKVLKDINGNTADKIPGAADKAVRAWIWILLVYAFAASIMPVWLLLQPRDYLNSFKLYIGLLIIFAGIIISFETVKAPALNTVATDLPNIFPFLFITIACGAISGFHCMVSSGTSGKQLEKEPDAVAVGYGSMILEGILAVAAILACTAGFASQEAWFEYYGSWKAVDGLGPKLNAFINGSVYLMESVGIGKELGSTFVAVVLVAFAMTSLDSGTRLLRYTFEELFTFKRKHGDPVHLHNPWKKTLTCTLLAVVLIGFFALYKGSGLALWGLFGTTNQLLASFALLTATIYLLRRKRKTMTVSIPAGLMFIVTLTAVIANITKFAKGEKWLLFSVGLVLLGMSIWLLVEAGITIAAIVKSRDKRSEISKIKEMEFRPKF